MSITSIAEGIVVGLGLTAMLPGPVLAQDFARGQELYRHHCNACHNDFAFGGKDREVKSLSELRKRVAGWAAHTGQEWGKSEIDDVLFYLDQSFYHFKEKKT